MRKCGNVELWECGKLKSVNVEMWKVEGYTSLINFYIFRFLIKNPISGMILYYIHRIFSKNHYFPMIEARILLIYDTNLSFLG